MLIFEHSQANRSAAAQIPKHCGSIDLPAALLRTEPPTLPEVSELQAVRHYTQLSQKNFCIETNFYPLGSCTMKYNPKGTHKAANQPGFLEQHPLAPETSSQGLLACLFRLQETLKEVSGMSGASLSPMAGAQGEFTGIAMIRGLSQSQKRSCQNTNYSTGCSTRHQSSQCSDVWLRSQRNPDQSIRRY